MKYSFKNVCSNVIPAGSYKALVSDVKLKTDAHNASAYIFEVHYTITEGAYANKTLIDSIREAAFSFRLKPFLIAVGADMNREFDSAEDMYRYGVSQAKNKTVMIDVIVRPYNGNEYNNVNAVSALPTATASIDDVMAEFGSIPDLAPAKPTVADIPEVKDVNEPLVQMDDVDNLF